MANNGLINRIGGFFGNLLSKPGDHMELHSGNTDLQARVTQTGRQVIKMTDGITKKSAVRYSSGKIVTTEVFDPNK
jgi:hypothetical protein